MTWTDATGLRTPRAVLRDWWRGSAAAAPFDHEGYEWQQQREKYLALAAQGLLPVQL